MIFVHAAAGTGPCMLWNAHDEGLLLECILFFTCHAGGVLCGDFCSSSAAISCIMFWNMRAC
jgi:hypothetical protein